VHSINATFVTDFNTTKVRYLDVRLMPKEFQLLVYILHFWGVDMTDWMNLCYIEFMAVTTLRQMPHTEIDDFFIQRFHLKNLKSKSLFR
jgi:hypothetical protein